MFRNSFRGNRGNRGGWTGRARTASPSPAPPFGPLIENVAKDSLDSDEFDHPGPLVISDVRSIASYNWVNASGPRIMIPGRPPRWTPLQEPRRLPWDDGEYYRDINAASYPDHPLEAAVVSVMKMCPEPTPVDIVACSNILGNLVRFAMGISQDRPFRFLVEIVGDTVHFTRRENSPKELIPGVKGFGHSFPEAYTTWGSDVRRSKSHQRIIGYHFGGLNFIVRSAGDGYIEPANQTDLHSSRKNDDQETLETQFLGLHVGNTASKPDSTAMKLTAAHGGKVVPQSSVFDLKTRSVLNRNKDVLGDHLPRLWVSQIEQFVLAFHTKGLFEEKDIQITDIKADILDWQEINQPSLRKFLALLRLIISRARSAANGRIEVYCSSEDCLEIREQLPGAGIVLSGSLKEDWSRWLENGARRTKGDPSVVALRESEHAHDGAEDDKASVCSSDSDEPDYTACDGECGYCGRCKY